MKKIYVLSTLSCAMVFSACSPVDSVKPFDQEQAARLLEEHMSARPTAERIALHLSNKENWQRIDLSLMNKGSPIMLVPKNETYKDWTESIRTKISAYMHEPNMTPALFLQQEMSSAKDNCKVVNTEILSRNAQAIVYKMSFADCYNAQPQNQIGKIFNGKDAVYLVRYAAVTNTVSNAHYQQMQQVIMNSELVPNPFSLEHY